VEISLDNRPEGCLIVKDITKVFEDSEKEITNHLINMAKQNEYTRYTSTNMKDWSVSIKEITKGIIDLINFGYLTVE